MARGRGRGKGRKPAVKEEVVNETDDSNIEVKSDLMAETVETEDPKVAEEKVESDAHMTDESDYSEQLTSKGCNAAAVTGLKQILTSGHLTYEEITDEIFAAVNNLLESNVSSALNEFIESDFPNLSNVPGHLLSILKAWDSDSQSAENGKATESQDSEEPNINEKVKELLAMKDYKHEVTNSIRRFGPPNNYAGDPPGHGTEVFIGKLPRDLFEDELVPLIDEKVGLDSIYDLRIMLDPNTGNTRGFAFVCFRNKEDMQKCVKELNDYEVRPGRHLKLNRSTPNLRLFVGNIPKQKTKEEILEEFKSKAEGLNDVIVYAIPDDPKKKNRGFAFLEFDSHHNASIALKRLGRFGNKAWNNDIVVDWAEPLDEPDEETMAKVKILYVKNLRADTTEDELRTLFGEHGTLEKVKKVKDYAFIHYNERDGAVKAIEAMNNTDIAGNIVEISLAKPVSEQSRRMKDRRHNHFYGNDRGHWGRGGGMMPNYRPPNYGPRGGHFGGMRGGMRGGMPPMGMAPGGFHDSYMWGSWGEGGYYDDGGFYGGGYGNRGWMPGRGGRGGFMGGRGGPRGGRGWNSRGDRGGFKRKQHSQGQDSKKPKVDSAEQDQDFVKQDSETSQSGANNSATNNQWYEDSIPTGETW